MHSSSASKNKTWQMPSFAYILAGKGVVFEISKVAIPSHSGSKGVTLTMIPHLAYVLLPKQIVKIFRGILKYSTDRASAKELGGMIQNSPSISTKHLSSNFLGSTIVLCTAVKTLKTSATLMS